MQNSMQILIDVGGTFTDCILLRPDGRITSLKTLSSAVIRGRVDEGSTYRTIVDHRKNSEPDNFYRSYELRLLDSDGSIRHTSPVSAFDAASTALQLERPCSFTPITGMSYELTSGESAPLLGIRRLLGLRLDEPVGAIDLRLGSTRGTNALLERKGSRTVFITTEGFADLPQIGNQARPELFALAINKPASLVSDTIEVGGRLDAEGRELQEFDTEVLRRQLLALGDDRSMSLAICLPHAWRNPAHEQEAAALARELGFTNLSLSSELAPVIGLLDRADTTLLDAYLAPTIRREMELLQAGLPQAAIRYVTSSGSLAGARQFRAVDSILSGPAGGVVGAARAAETAGLCPAITFDMGGTSTDVSRYEARFEYQSQSVKDGIRIAQPLLAIETVAAGGGSICRFDGRRLLVGPASAGADPGPACYGRGGPLTITDMNLITGRIIDEHFQFPLDPDAARQQLDSLCRQIATQQDLSYSVVQLAEAFIRIANERMAAAIKAISTARGYDPSDHSLVAYGGAAPQHACALAELLGIQTVLIHPLAGVLSAYGAGQADITRLAEQTLLVDWSPSVPRSLAEEFLRLTARAREAVLAERVSAERIQAARLSFSMRYKGTQAALSIDVPEDGDWRAAFEERHIQYYGYRQQARPVELVAIRVSVTGLTPKAGPNTLAPAAGAASPMTHQPVSFGGQWQSTPVFHRAPLRPGHIIAGPALITDEYSTILIEPCWRAELNSEGSLILRSDQSQAKRPSGDTRRDPLRLELFNNAFTQIAEQMGLTLQKTAISTNVKERLDFSCALLDGAGNLLVNAPHIPVHLGAISATVKSLLNAELSMRPGDVFLSNSPDYGGSHLPDLTVVTPVFAPDSASIRFFTASRAHHAEIGGVRPGSGYPFATSLAEEGVVFNAFRIVEQGRFCEDELRELLTTAPYPSRAAEENIADLRAAIAANHIGAGLLIELSDEHSYPTIKAYMKYLRELSAAIVRDRIRQIPDGRYQFKDEMDDGAAIFVRIEVDGTAMTIDFSGSAPVQANSINANAAIVGSAVLYCLRCMIKDPLPLNSGMLEALRLVIPPGMLNPPAHSDPRLHAAVVGGNVEISQRIVDVIFGALGIAAASQGTMNNIFCGNERFSYYETLGGGSGAGPCYDGSAAVHSHMTNTRLSDVEILEHNYPMRVLRLAIRRGSGGAGRFQGGDGMIREIEFLDSLELSLLTQRRKRGPFGLRGGRDGAPGTNFLTRAGSAIKEEFPSLAHTTVRSGDRLEIHTPGGGGWGDSADSTLTTPT